MKTTRLSIVVAALTMLVTVSARAQYHTYAQVETFLANEEAAHPTICKRVNLGTSVQGRTMWALCISDNPNTQEDEPEFVYISTMHGDEPVGTENCLSFIDYLTTNYGSDSRVNNIVNNVETWIVPCMNPDGMTLNTRENAHGIDLNRNFPDIYTSPTNTTAGREPETANIMNWRMAHSFMAAANFHTGALVVNYPYDTNAAGNAVYTACPDDDFFIWVSEQYSSHNTPMWNSSTFTHGITNGADWYVVFGGMQDWSYNYMGCNEVTIELSNTKTPSASTLPTLWNDNRESMLSYLEACLVGVRGTVTDALSGLPLAATVSVVGRTHNVFTDPDVGDYHRQLKPGTYDLRFDCAGKDSKVITGVVVGSGPATRLDVTLSAPAHVTTPNGGESLSVGQPATVTWTGHPTAQFHVQYTLNYGFNYLINDGFESGSVSGYTLGGNANWFATTGVVHAGTRSARAGAIGNSQTSWMTRSVTGPGNLSFYYDVSSEGGFDFFKFYIDGVVQLQRSGNVGWTNYAAAIAAGNHTLKWEYSKDTSVASGSDTVWIDDVQFVVDTTSWSDAVALTSAGATSYAWTPPAQSTTAKIRVQAYYGAGVYGGWDDSDAVFAIVPAPTHGDLNCDSVVNAADAAAMAQAVVDPDGYVASHPPPCNILQGDVNDDSLVNGDDLRPFLGLLP